MIVPGIKGYLPARNAVLRVLLGGFGTVLPAAAFSAHGKAGL
ncbi:MAG: hypothetical protein AB7C89_03850 [Intestinibacillus sp.]